jgi:nanoRNase/pAp phosphatase (c-di-AMP/oligoRNAs hydrolase)
MPVDEAQRPDPDALMRAIEREQPGKGKLKISIGFNPWCNQTRLHNIAKICERHGGGGHPVVGAISRPVDKVEDAKKLAKEIATELGK